MTISYPRAMLCGVVTTTFELARFNSTNRLGGGATQVREWADPRWRAEFHYAPMDRTGFQALQAWLDSLDGGLNLLLGHDPLKPYPLTYAKTFFTGLTRAGGGAFDGTASVSTVAAAGFTLATLPAGFVLKAGDMVGLIQAGKYGLFRIMEDVVASSGGGAAVIVRPRVPTALFTAAALANLVRPSCTMILDPASVAAARQAVVRSPISFSAVQALS